MLGLGLALTNFGTRGGVSDIADGGFSPLSLSPAAFWDVTDTSTLYQERGGGTTLSVLDGVVGTIRDKSGNGRNLSNSTDAARPLLRSTSGYSNAEFDGVDDFLTAAVTGLATPCRIMWALAIPTLANSLYLRGAHTSGGNEYGLLNGTTNLTMFSGVTPRSLFPSSPAASTFVVIDEIWNGASSSIQINTTTATTGTMDTGTLGGVTFGGNRFGSFQCSTLRLVSCIIVSGTLSAGDAASLRTYMGAKVGVTL
jgi:hypothetical protein